LYSGIKGCLNSTFGCILFSWQHFKNNMRNYLFTLVIFILTKAIYAQSNPDVKLIVGGQGMSIESATNNALRSAIEQAFGTYISSKTEILNDELNKDEIVSISSGNIKSYKIISQTNLENNEIAVSLEAVVSVNAMVSFFKAKGVEAEFQGGLFAANMLQQELNAKNELIVIRNLIEIFENIEGMFNYELIVSEPKVDPEQNSNDNFIIDLSVNISSTTVFDQTMDYILKSVEALSMKKDEALNLINVGKKVYPISVGGIYALDKKGREKEVAYYYIMRSKEAQNEFQNLVRRINSKALSIEVESNVNKTMSLNRDEAIQKIANKLIFYGPIQGADFNDKERPICYSFNLPNAETAAAQKKVGFYNLCNKKIDKDFPFVNGLRKKMIEDQVSVEIWEWDKNVPYTFTVVNPGVLVSFAIINSSSSFATLNFRDQLNNEMIKKVNGYKIINVK
jgi:hypothetical protein